MATKKKLNPYQQAAARLTFMNSLRTDGKSFDSVAKAYEADPRLAKICKKLTAEQIDFLNDRIEDITDNAYARGMDTGFTTAEND